MGLTQKELAERMGCSQQYVSLILKGKENLTLETIAKLETALDFELFISTRNLDPTTTRRCSKIPNT